MSYLNIMFYVISGVISGNAQGDYSDMGLTQKMLVDRIYTLPIFIDTDSDCWAHEEKEHFYNELIKSQQWISDQAARYNQDVTWDNDFFDLNRQTIYLNKYNRFSPRLMLEGTLDAMLEEDFDEYLENARFNSGSQKLKLVYFVKSNDRSLAVNFRSTKKVDIAIIFCRSSYGMMTDQYTISHEILHQFGAWDLYFGRSQSEEKAERARQLFPRSIMINTHVNKDQLRVDELTAWRVGWHSDHLELYDDFKPDWKFRQKGGKTITAPVSMEPK